MKPPVLSSVQMPPIEEPAEVGFSELMRTAGRQENAVYNAIEWLRRDKRPPIDPTFVFSEAAKNSPWANTHLDKLIKAGSLAEFQLIEQQIAREEADRALLASQGWAGFGAAMVMGVMDPTVLIPVVGAGSKGARAIAEAFGLGAIGATASELPLYANQITRTEGELALGIGAGTLLGGLLGSAAAFMRKSDFDRLSQDMVAEVPEGRLPPLLEPDGRVETPPGPRLDIPDQPPRPKLLNETARKQILEALETRGRAALVKLRAETTDPGVMKVVERLLARMPVGVSPKLEDVIAGEPRRDRIAELLENANKEKINPQERARLVEEFTWRYLVKENPELEQLRGIELQTRGMDLYTQAKIDQAEHKLVEQRALATMPPKEPVKPAPPKQQKPEDPWLKEIGQLQSYAQFRDFFNRLMATGDNKLAYDVLFSFETIKVPQGLRDYVSEARTLFRDHTSHVFSRNSETQFLAPDYPAESKLLGEVLKDLRKKLNFSGDVVIWDMTKSFNDPDYEPDLKRVLDNNGNYIPRMNGVYFVHKGKAVIGINFQRLKSDKNALLDVFAHEFGHLFQYQSLANAPTSTKLKIFNEYMDERQGKSSARIYADTMNPTMVKSSFPQGIIESPDPKMRAYHRSFVEWFANRMTNVVVTGIVPESFKDKAIRAIIDGWKAIVDIVRKYRGDRLSVEEFFNSVDLSSPKAGLTDASEVVPIPNWRGTASKEILDDVLGSFGENVGTIKAKKTEPTAVPKVTYYNAEGVAEEVEVVPPPDPGGMAPATLLGRIASYTSPVLRAINQYDMPIKSPFVRRLFQKLSDSGVDMEKNKFGVATTAEGTVEHRLGFYVGMLGTALRFQHETYVRYAYGKDIGFLARQNANLRVEFNKAPPGKLSFYEFKQRVAHAMNKGDVDEIPEVQEVAEHIRKEVFEKIHSSADNAAKVWGERQLYENFTPTDDLETYFRHQFSPEAVEQYRMDFIDDVAKHFEQKLQAHFTKMVDKWRRRVSEDLDYEELVRLERGEAEKMMKELEQMLKDIRDPGSFGSDYDQMKALRAEARALREAAFERLQETNTDLDPRVTAENRAKAREETQEEYTRLMAEADKIEDGLPPEVAVSRKEKAQVRKKMRALSDNLYLRAGKQAELYQKIAKNEEMNLRNFERVVREHDRFVKASNKLSPEKYQEQVARLVRSTELAILELTRADKALRRANEFGNENLIQQMQDRLLMAAERLDKVNARMKAAQAKDPAVLQQLLKEQRDAAFDMINKINNTRAERNAQIRAKAKDLEPEVLERELRDRRNARRAEEDDIAARLREEGGEIEDLFGGRFSFKRAARDAATDLQNRIAGNTTRIAQFDMLPQLRSPMKRRMLDLPYEIKQKYLELDTEKVLSRYVRTMGSDIELFRATGSVDGSRDMRLLRDEFDRLKDLLATREKDEAGKVITPDRRAKELAQLSKAQNHRMREYEGLIERIRGIRGRPKDPQALSYRLGQLFINWNVTSMMGSAAITSIPDVGRAVMVHGLMRTFRDSWKPFIQGLVDESQSAQNEHLIRQLRLMGIGNDVYTNVRSRGTFEFGEVDFASRTQIERFFEFTAAKTPTVALFGPWTDFMKQISASATMARLLTAIEDLSKGKISQDELKYLASASISPDMARRIQAEMDATGTRYKNVTLPNVEKWKDYEAMRAFHAAMSREDARIVITPGLEKPLWMDASMLGRIVGQFRSFTMAANTKILISGLQSRDMAAVGMLQGTVFSLAMGALSYYIWAVTSGERAIKEMQEADWETWIDQAIYRSGLLGAFSEIQNIGAEIPATAGLVTFGGGDLAGRRANSVLGAVLGPSFGKAENIAQFLVGIDEPTEGTVQQARRLLPYQNVFYLRRALDYIDQETADMFGLPERRGE